MAGFGSVLQWSRGARWPTRIDLHPVLAPIESPRSFGNPPQNTIQCVHHLRITPDYYAPIPIKTLWSQSAFWTGTFPVRGRGRL